jgi:hypothetical protein
VSVTPGRQQESSKGVFWAEMTIIFFVCNTFFKFFATIRCNNNWPRMPFSCDYQALIPRVRGPRPVQDKTWERGRSGHTSQKSSVGFAHQSLCNRFIVRSATGGSAQVCGVATLQASPRIAHKLCLSSSHLKFQCNDRLLT